MFYLIFNYLIFNDLIWFDLIWFDLWYFTIWHTCSHAPVTHQSMPMLVFKICSEAEWLVHTIRYVFHTLCFGLQVAWRIFILYKVTSSQWRNYGRGNGGTCPLPPPSRGLCSPGAPPPHSEFWKNTFPFEAAPYKMFTCPLEKVVHPLVPPKKWTLVTPLLPVQH